MLGLLKDDRQPLQRHQGWVDTGYVTSAECFSFFPFSPRISTLGNGRSYEHDDSMIEMQICFSLLLVAVCEKASSQGFRSPERNVEAEPVVVKAD